MTCSVTAWYHVRHSAQLAVTGYVSELSRLPQNSAGSPTGVEALGWQGPYLVGFPSAERHAWVTASQGEWLLKQLQNNTLKILGAH